ncbi:MAG TPA: tetratricopeptide repeat protein [Steroidobacteraceae bacterium]|nr:tetratricopeptide repeat protein [Steroidobacteraceae bacterium]
MEEYLSEREQWDQIKSWLRENGLWIIAGVVVGAAGLGGWRWYQDHVDSVGAAASAKYTEAVQAFVKGDRTQAFVLLGELERDYSSSPYVDQAKLMAARVYVDGGDLDKAATELQAVTDHSKDNALALIARLRLARVEIAQKKPDAALATLNGLKAGAFEPRYHEVLGDAYYAKGDKTNALKEYMSAKVVDMAGSSLDTQGLDLKIDDLTAENPHAMAQAATPPAASAAAK